MKKAIALCLTAAMAASYRLRQQDYRDNGSSRE